MRVPSPQSIASVGGWGSLRVAPRKGTRRMNLALDRMSKAEFARHMGWSDTRVSQLAKAHRLVLDSDDLVIVERSKALIAATRKSVTRGGDQTGKHARLAAAERAAAATAADSPLSPAEPSAPVSAGATPPDLGALASLSLADVVRAEKIERARGLRLQNAKEAGDVVRRAVVEAEAFRCARQAQELLLALRDRLPPLLAAMNDERAIGALLDTELRHVIATIAATPAMAETKAAA